MIHERYVNAKIAQILKDKGFDEPCRSYYLNYGKRYSRCAVEITNKDLTSDQLLRPTQAMVRTWLRKKYYIYADTIKQGNYSDCSEYYTWIVARMGIIHRNSSVADKLSYEEAEEISLTYALENLI